jgi:hypothetical protein
MNLNDVGEVLHAGSQSETTKLTGAFPQLFFVEAPKSILITFSYSHRAFVRVLETTILFSVYELWEIYLSP